MMLVGCVRGNVISTNKAKSLSGAKLLIVRPVCLGTMKEKNDYIVCVDDAGAGEGDLVFCAYGSSARQTISSAQFASDYSIYGIIDSIDIKNLRVYSKAKAN